MVTRSSEDLVIEIERLQGELRVVSEQLAHERAMRKDNIYVFDDEDESRAAFDEFFGAPDPHLEKVRGFLLD